MEKHGIYLIACQLCPSVDFMVAVNVFVTIRLGHHDNDGSYPFIPMVMSLSVVVLCIYDALIKLSSLLYLFNSPEPTTGTTRFLVYWTLKESQ